MSSASFSTCAAGTSATKRLGRAAANSGLASVLCLTQSQSANRSGGLGSNREHFEPTTEMAQGVDPELADLAYDPQTSGGLLAAVDAAVADEVCLALSASAAITVRPIGRVEAPQAPRVRLIP